MLFLIRKGCVCVYVYLPNYLSIYIYIYIGYIYIYLYMCVCVCAYICVCVCVCIYIFGILLLLFSYVAIYSICSLEHSPIISPYPLYFSVSDNSPHARNTCISYGFIHSARYLKLISMALPPSAR